MALSGRESSLVQTFCESCVHLDTTHPSVHMTQRFVIQGCPKVTVILAFTQRHILWFCLYLPLISTVYRIPPVI